MEDWTVPGIAKFAYFSYHLIFGVTIWSELSLLQLSRSWQANNSETPSACSMKRDVSYQMESSSKKVVEENANSMTPDSHSVGFHSLPPLTTLSSLLGHCPVFICLLLNKL